MKPDQMQIPEPHAQLVDVERGTVELSLPVPPELEHFRGHFPGFGVLPGVVQIDWAVRLARRYLPVPEGGFLGMDQIKFQALVLPGAVLQLTLQWDPKFGRLVFSYHAGGKICSSGRLTWSFQE